MPHVKVITLKFFLRNEKAQEGDSKKYLECPICDRILDCSLFTADQPLNPLDQHHFYCPIIDTDFPLWKESLESIPEQKVYKVNVFIFYF